MSLFVPKFDESVIVREADAEVVGGDPVGVRLLADSPEVQELYDNHYLRSEAWDARD